MSKTRAFIFSIFLIILFLATACLLTSCSDKSDGASTNNSSQQQDNPPHIHSYGAWTIEVEPTCVTEGLRYRACACGDIQQESIAMVEHAYSDWVLLKSATCTENGMRQKACVNCGNAFSEIILAVGHKEVIDVAVDATCINNGKTEGKHCEICGEIIIPQQIIEPLGHSYTEQVFEPTCTEQGYVLHSCSRCGVIYKDQYVLPLYHDFTVPIETISATCTESEYTIYKCSRCDVTTKNHIGSPLGHRYINGVCERCGLPEGMELGQLANNCYSVKSYTGQLSELEIPSSIGGHQVTQIETGAFENCTSLVSITIPKSILKIGKTNDQTQGIFSGCNNLKNIYYTGDVGDWCSIDMDASFWDTMLSQGLLINLFIGGEKVEGNIVIPEGTKSVNGGAFYYRTNITSVELPKSLNSIQGQAFFGCVKLVEIYNKSNISISIGDKNNGNIGAYAKNVYSEPNCSKLSQSADGYVIYEENDEKVLVAYLGNEDQLILPNDITHINNGAFYMMTHIKSVLLPNGLKFIGEGAFLGCVGLVTITIPQSVEEIGDSAFYWCIHLMEIYNISPLNIVAGESTNGCVAEYAKAVYVEPYISKLSKVDDGYIIYVDGEDITLISYEGDGIDIELPNNITKIWMAAIYNTNVNSLTIHNSIKKIYPAAFVGCKVKQINYDGTVEQWNNIIDEEINGWIFDSPDYVVYCLDGEIHKQ